MVVALPNVDALDYVAAETVDKSTPNNNIWDVR